MSIDNDKRIFNLIRPKCVALSQIALAPKEIINTQSPDLINALREVYETLNTAINIHDVLSSNLTDYIFVPLSYLLKLPNLNDTTITYILRILSILIKHSWAANLPYALARQLFPLIAFLTGGPPNPKDDTVINKKSDELKLAGSVTLNEFFKGLLGHKHKKDYDFFSNVENLPALGHSVTVLLNFAEKSNDVDLQLQSLSTLSTLYFDLIDDGEVISYILPGNVSSLAKILAVKGTNTHYTVIVKAISLLENLLVLVYDDDDLSIEFKEIESIDDALEEEFDHIQLRDANFAKIHRTKSWLRGTSSQVKIALGNLVILQNHSKVEVKESLLRFCKSLMSHCLYSLSSSIPIVVKIMANLSDTISVDFNPIKHTKNPNFLQSILSSEMNHFIDSFASTIQSPDYNKISMNINSIKFLSDFNENEYLISKLVNTTILEINDMLVKKTFKSKIIAESDSISNLMIVMKDMNNLSLDTKRLTVYDKVLTKDIQVQLSGLFQTLGEKIDPTNIINEILLDDVDKTLNEKGISLWIANNLMQGYTSKIQPDIIVDEFLDFKDGNEVASLQKPKFMFTILDYCKGLINEISETQATPQIEQINSIAIDTIGVVANLMKAEFETELVDYLYPVIDSLASPSDVVRNHALNTSMIIADNLYAGSLNQMIVQNTDYLIDSISIRLSNAMTTRSTAILAACTKLVGYEIIDGFKDVIEITFSLLDYYHGYEDLCMDFFVLFEIIIDEISKKYLNDTNTSKLETFESDSTFKPWGLRNVNQLINLLDKSKRDVDVDFNKPSSFEDNEESKIQEVDSDDEDDPIDTKDKQPGDEESERQFKEEILKWVSPIPQPTYKLLQQIASYSERLLTHPSVKLKLQILRTLNKSIPLFATQPNNLLPIVANLWPIVSNLVMNEDPKVVIGATNVLTNIIKFADSFVNQRFIEFWSKCLKNHHLFKTTSKISTSTKKLNLPGLNLKCFNKLVDLLTFALNKIGRYIPDIIIYEMIDVCIIVIEDVERFGEFSDIAWVIKMEKRGSFGDTNKPESVALSGKCFSFIDVN